ncbi:MAG: glycine--tRNA ligase subunit beta [Gammaproteobacteria bacterium]|nr:glycine--tRNA ligase subunit beta [Gammaproteobacteria bacterium]
MPEANETAARDFLFEIGTEELPPKALRGLSEALEAEFRSLFAKAGLDHGELRSFATPRRLALLARDLAGKQPDRETERFGPALAAAYDADGVPTAAALGFARSCGVSVEELGSSERQGAAKLSFTKLKPGTDTVELLPGMAETALAALPIPRRMRWGSSRTEFIRPVHWAVMLFGEEVVPASILGETAGNVTFGHRFHYDKPIELSCPGDYEAALESPGRVIACFERRRELVRDLVAKQASSLKRSIAQRAGTATERRLVIDDESQLRARVVEDKGLLNEVTSLVEYPVALTGAFEPEFLQLPEEALILTLKFHQKCFSLEDESGQLVPNFVTVSNIESLDPKEVVKGNERVIRPRLADARFFFETDKSRSLESRLPELEKAVFQEKLGTIAAKSRRVAALSRHIAESLSVEPDACERAAMLGKCDLVSDMVGEFAELQGIMGSYYARNDGEPESVAAAIFEQYLPRHTGDRLPESDAGRVVALAEKLDTLAGLFAIGQPPTGSRDPFALRRAALGVLRILIEGGLELDLVAVIDAAVDAYAEIEPKPGCRQQLYDFIFDRLRAWYIDAGTDAKIYLCVRALNPASPLDFHRRVEAVADFAGRPEAAALAAANKRVSNLLDKSSDAAGKDAVAAELLSEAAEKQLLLRLEEQSEAVAPLFEAGDYREGLTRLAGLRDDVDKFFDEVMVMVDDPSLRANRLRMLRDLRDLFLQVADISLL